MTLILDTETGGFNGPVLEVAALLYGRGLEWRFVARVGWPGPVFIHPKAQEVNGISAADLVGCPAPATIHALMAPALAQVSQVVAFNARFDSRMMQMFWESVGVPVNVRWRCAMLEMQRRMNVGKFPSLQEAHRFVTGKDFENAHEAMSDVLATRVLIDYLNAAPAQPSPAQPAPAPAQLVLV